MTIKGPAIENSSKFIRFQGLAKFYYWY